MSMERGEQLIRPVAETGQKRKADLMSRFIETRVIGGNETLEAEEEQELREYYAALSPRERADILYGKMMAFMIDRQTEKARKKDLGGKDHPFEYEKPDPYLISEIKILFSDPEVKQLLPSTYGEARVDVKNLRASEMANLWEQTVRELHEKEMAYQELERSLHLNEISGSGKVSAAKSRMARLAENLSSLEKRKAKVATLEGLPHTIENTDAAANFQYENLKEYRRQLVSGFVWLPTRKRIHQKTVSAILNHRWPVLIGEAGSGKSDQADAAALELTGHLPTHIACSSKTGEVDLIKDIAIDRKNGGSYDKYGALMQAYTGYEDSRQEKSAVQTGRIVRLDEAYRIPHESSGYSILKETRQVKAGDLFHDRKVLPGAGAIWTTNPPGPRYPGRTVPDAAMRREVAEIEVPYPEMSLENPELYEFALAALQDENYHIAASEEELAPSYEKKEIPENQREVLEDGSIVVAKDQIIQNMADQRHGALWRFTAAIKALQDSFVYGNAGTEKYPDSLLRFKEDADENIEVTSDGTGDPLTLSSSTVTLGELSSWMEGWNERRQKQDQEFRVETLTEWLNFKIKTYLDQADKDDKGKLRAIFRHFGFLDRSIVPDSSKADPLTPRKIGYLSPRVPRPVYLEKPAALETADAKPAATEFKEARGYETREVLLEDGSKVLMKIKNLDLENGIFDPDSNKLASIEISIGKKFTIQGESFVFAGIVEDESHPLNGQPVGQLASGEKLYRVFTAQELDRGIEQEFKNLIGETGIDDLKDDLLDYWRNEGCKDERGEFVF